MSRTEYHVRPHSVAYLALFLGELIRELVNR